MNNQPNINGNHGMMDILKTQMLSMMMIQGANGNNGNKSSFDMIWGMIALTIVDNVMAALPFIINFIQNYINNFIKQKKELIEQNLKIDNSKENKKIKTASITVNTK
jgi:hypothetical protein